MDFQLIATAASTLLAPFIPYFLKAGKDLGSKLVELVSQKGGELVGKKAQEVWEKLERKLGDDPEVQAARDDDLCSAREPATARDVR